MRADKYTVVFDKIFKLIYYIKYGLWKSFNKSFERE